MIENHLYQGLKSNFFFGVPSDELRQVCGHQVAKLWSLKISAFFTGINLDQNWIDDDLQQSNTPLFNKVSYTCQCVPPQFAFKEKWMHRNEFLDHFL